MPEHGTNACYNSGCREPQCVEAHREYQREYRERTRPAMSAANTALKRLPRDHPDYPHGARPNGYPLGYVYGCRCDECKEANGEHRAAEARRAGRVNPNTPYVPMKEKPVPEHGTRARYQRGCKCPPCRQAHSDYSAAWQRLRTRGIPWNDPDIDRWAIG